MKFPSGPKAAPTTFADRIAAAGLDFVCARAMGLGGEVKHAIVLVRVERKGAAAGELQDASSAAGGFDNALEMLSAMVQHVQAVAAGSGIDREALAALILGGGSDG